MQNLKITYFIMIINIITNNGEKKYLLQISK